MLVNYVAQYGREWEKLGQLLGKTAGNVRDKYRSMGEENVAKRVKAKWSLKETMQLISLIEENCGVKILSKKANKLKESDLDLNYRPKRISKNNLTYQPDAVMKALSAHIKFERAKGLKLEGIPWTDISLKIGSKSRDDCRNRWYLQIYNCIFEKSAYSDRDDKKLFESIRNQNIEVEEDIDFESIENGKSAHENSYRWSKLKKLVNSRFVYTPESLMAALGQYFMNLKASKKGMKGKKGLKDQNQKDGIKNSLVQLFRISYSA